ncbi:late embryogenesis abundant protein [Jejuia pallidilutea]|uniref:Late embryogenesis abundant protein n=1 Tax=Jejuia pallidilutea TaxID=504487 RepID=A0A362X286_9FLAO|nr:LEA type 2 family protein [Jejuia pallidilutea]PQV50506.1 late embryogenesis abundant protein [Jejuia pallidilutea]
MKRFLILLTILCTFFNCKVNEKPLFVSVENIKVVESNSKNIILSADALFRNPNDIGGELKTDEIKIYVNNNEVGYVSTKSFEVPAKKEFTIPLTATVPVDSLISNKSIGGLIGSLFSKKIKVNYKGTIVYKALGFSYDYAVDETEEVKIKF